MKRTIKLTLICVALLGASLTFVNSAGAVTIGSANELGFVFPGIPSSDQDKQDYVNHLVGMAVGTVDLANGLIYNRSSNVFGTLPSAVLALSGTGTTVNLGSGSLYSYLLVTYIGIGSKVWYVGNLTGAITIPGSPFTQWTLFG